MIELQSTITCPQCGHRQSETMLTDFCQFFYDCKGCGEALKPKAGDCCGLLLLRHGALPADSGGAVSLERTPPCSRFSPDGTGYLIATPGN